MDIRQLRYFVTIVESRSISKASERVHVAQPALSQQIASLESDLGTQLLVRSSRGVEATRAGMALYRHAYSILRQVDEARHDVTAATDEISGVVAVGMPTTTAAILAMPLLRACRQRYPSIRLQLFESMSGYLGELLANGRLDFAVLFRTTESLGVIVEPFIDEELYVMGDLAGAFDGLDRVPMSSMAAMPLVLPSASQELRHLIERAFAQNGVIPNVVADIDSLPTMLAAASEGFAITILPYSALACRLPSSPIHYRSLEPALHRSVSVCRLKSIPVTPAAEAMRRLVFELAGKAIASGNWEGATFTAAAGYAP